MIFGGEIHPFRLPSSGLWIDVFQKVKALGYNAVSYYVHWYVQMLRWILQTNVF